MIENHDLIFVSLEYWDEMWRRNQFICAELMRRYPEMKILFVTPSRDLSAGLRRWDWDYLRGPKPGVVPEFPNLHFLEANKLLPKSSSLGRSINSGVVRRGIKKRMETLGLRDPILWINSHEMGHLAGELGEAYCIYDITDDWTQMSNSPRLNSIIVQQDQTLCHKADAVIVCSEDLFKTRGALTENLHLIPNGVNVEHYRRVMEGPCTRPENVKELTGQVLGYTGTIHPDRMDIELLLSIACDHPESTLLLIGPSHLSEQDRKRFSLLGNVKLIGPVAYDEIPDYMALFDVCIVPHLVNTFTESLNPIKLWEYLASGKPIISTAVAGFRDYSHLVELADDAAGFSRSLVRCMHEGKEAACLRQQEALKHTWSDRVDQIVNVFECCESSSKVIPR